MNKQAMVREFMQEAGQHVPDKLTQPSLDIMMLRYKLISEELHELWLAVDSYYVMSQHDFMTEVADALADLLYVVYGAAVACGMDIDAVFEEVHKSNMTKFIDGYKREDGKWIRGRSYVSPNIARIIEAQNA